MNELQPLVLLLDDNLMSAPRVQRQLELMGFQVLVGRRRDALESTYAQVESLGNSERALQLILINLGSRALDGVTQIAPLRERFPAARLAGYCGHLETEIRRAARAVGIERIITNEQAFSDLPNALKVLAGKIPT